MFVQRQPEEVQRWHFAFHVKRHEWWGERFIPGRFSHVSAFAYLWQAKVWILIEQSPRTNTRVIVWPDMGEGEMPPMLVQWTMNCGILAADVRRRYDFRPSFGFWCVTAVKSLIGFRSWALSPEGLWRDMIANGASIVYDIDGGRQPAAAATGPGSPSPIGDGAEPAAAGGPS